MQRMNKWSVAVVFALALTIGARAWGEEQKAAKCGGGGYAKCDADNDGKVTLAEFMAGCGAGDCAKKKEKMEAKFKAMDKDGDGALTKEEFAAGCAKKEGGKCKRAPKGECSKPAEK